MIPPIPTSYRGVTYRSRTEARWAVFFRHAGIAVEYEPEGFRLAAGPYLPDFRAPAYPFFLEVKGALPTEGEREKCRQLSAATETLTLLAEGAPREQFQLHVFSHGTEREELYVFASGQDGGGMWLVERHGDGIELYPNGEEPSAGSGPVFGPLEPAYAAAQDERFDGRPRVGRVHGHEPAPKPRVKRWW